MEIKMKVYILLDSESNVIAVYDNKDIAAKMLPVIEAKINDKLVLQIFKMNQDIKLIGL
jgi:hypothetical protein